MATPIQNPQNKSKQITTMAYTALAVSILLYLLYLLFATVTNTEIDKPVQTNEEKDVQINEKKEARDYDATKKDTQTQPLNTNERVKNRK